VSSTHEQTEPQQIERRIMVRHVWQIKNVCESMMNMRSNHETGFDLLLHSVKTKT